MNDREIRTGAHLLAAAKSLGWKDDGEGAFEFVVRRSREVALEDCASRIEALEAALRRIVNGGTMVLLTASMDECPVNPDVLEQIINDARAALARNTVVPQERADG